MSKAPKMIMISCDDNTITFPDTVTRVVTAADSCDHRARVRIVANSPKRMDNLLVHLCTRFVTVRQGRGVVTGGSTPSEWSQELILGFDGDLPFTDVIDWPEPPKLDRFAVEIIPRVPPREADEVSVKAFAEPGALRTLHDFLRSKMGMPFRSRMYNHPRRDWFMLMLVVPE